MLKTAFASLVLVGCAAGSEPSSPPPSAPTPAAPAPVADKPVEVVAPTPAPVVAPEPTPVTATPTPAREWRARVTAEVSAFRTADAAGYTELTKLQPTATRAGHLRFATDAIQNPRVAAVFIDRLASGTEAEAVRVALAEALPRTGGNYADAIDPLLAAETAPSVRAELVATAKRLPAASAEPVIRRGLSDQSADVRASAARTAAAHSDGGKFATALRAALKTDDAVVRTEAARALGVHRVAAARADLLGLLGDTTADVRLESLRALDRIEPGSLRDHAALASLAKDPDSRVARLAEQLKTR